MKKVVICLALLFLLVGGFVNYSSGFYTQIGKQDVETVAVEKSDQAVSVDFQYACNGKQAQIIGEKGKAGIDFENTSFENGALLWSDPPAEGAKVDNSASIAYRSKAMQGAVALKVSTKYIGKGNFSIVDFKESKREVIFPINGTEEGKTCKLREIFLKDAQRFFSDKGFLEIHYSVLNGDVLDIESVEIEYVSDASASAPEVKVIQRYNYDYILPPGFSYSSYLYYHHGPIWIEVSPGVFDVYDKWWWYGDYDKWVEIHYSAYCGYGYYHWYDPVVYVQKEYVYVDHCPYSEHHEHHGGHNGRHIDEGRPEQLNRSAVSSDNVRSKNLAIIPGDSSKQGPINLGLEATKPTRNKTKIPMVGNVHPAPVDVSNSVILPIRTVDPLVLKATVKQKKEVQTSKGSRDFIDNRQVGYKPPSIDQINNPIGKPTRQKGIINRLTGGGSGDSQPKETRDISDISNVKRKSQGFLGRAVQAFGNVVFDNTGSSGSGGSSQSQVRSAPALVGGGNGSTSPVNPVVEMKKRVDSPPPASDDKDKDKSSGNGGDHGKKRR